MGRVSERKRFRAVLPKKRYFRGNMAAKSDVVHLIFMSSWDTFIS